VLERLNNGKEQHLVTIRFVVEICQRMGSLDLQNIARISDLVNQDDRINSTESEQLRGSERALYLTQVSLAEEGGGEVATPESQPPKPGSRHPTPETRNPEPRATNLSWRGQVVKEIISKPHLEALHPEAFAFASLLLERGNVAVQKRFKNEMAKDATFIQALAKVMQQAVDEARSSLLLIKRKHMRTQPAAVADRGLCLS